MVYTGLFLLLSMFLIDKKYEEKELNLPYSGHWENATYRVDTFILLIIFYFLYMEYMQIKS